MRLVDQVTRPVRGIQRSLAGLSQRAGLDRLARAARGVSQSMGVAVQRAMALGKRMLVMGGVAAGAVWGVNRLVAGVAEMGNEIQTASERLGVGTDWLQQWMYVGRQFGVQNDAMVDGLKELSLRADEFVLTAGGPAAEAFGRLGITTAQLKKTKGNTDALFNLVLGRLREVDNFAARQRLVDEIFGGTGGEQMAQMVSATREEIEAMMRAAHQVGAIIPPEQVAAAREYTRQMGDLQQMLTGIRTSVVGALLPAVNEWTKRMAALGRANREAVAQRILSGMREFWSVLRPIGAAVSWVADQVGGFGNLLGGLATIMATRLIVSVFATGVALVRLGFTAVTVGARLTVALLGGLVSVSRGLIGLAARAIPAAIMGIRALSLAFLTTPVGWIVTGIAAVAGAAFLIYRNWGSIADWFGNLWQGVKAFFSRGIGDIAKDLLAFSPAALLLHGIDAVFEMFGARPLTEIGGQWISGLWDGISARWDQLTGWMRGKVAELTSWMPDWARDGLGIGGGTPGGSSSPVAALGAPVARGAALLTAPMARADVGGELRIVIDSQGRPRVTEARRNGGLDFEVDSGVLGMAP
ncbi:phage tail protein [Bordetella petrii]|uniref:Phage tail protein n=2 Tax=Bordetella petrii TaxID=94624 RepID=A9ID73_BORPD|nr:phage tail protein [Bordetella petrii]